MTGNLRIAFFCIILALGSATAGGTSESTDFMKQHATSSDAVVLEEWAKLDINQRLDLLETALLDEANGLRTKRAVLENIIEATPPFMAGSETATLHSIYVSKLTEMAAQVWKFDYVGVSNKPEARLQHALNQIRERRKPPSVIPNGSESTTIALEPEMISPPAVLPTPQQKASESKSTPSAANEEPASSTPWSLIVVLIVAASGLLWLLLK